MEGLRTGRIVDYVLTEDDAYHMNCRRTTSESIRERVAADKWPIGAQAHVGNELKAGEHCPAMVVAIDNGTTVNLKVFLDGNDDYWAGSRDFSADMTPGTWHWLEKA